MYYNDNFVDVHSWSDYYLLTGLKANTLYNISVAAITGVNNDIIGDYVSITSTTSLGREYTITSIYSSPNLCILLYTIIL